MKSLSRSLILFIILVLLVSGNSNAQKKYKFPKPPKFTLTFALSYNYALSKAFGNLSSFSSVYDSTANGYVFNGPSYGMLQGGSFMTIGKWGVGKKRQLRFTMTLGYSLFYNSDIDYNNKNQWHLFNGTLGMEYNMAPKSRYRPYIGYELMYTLMFGSWQFQTTDASGNREVNYYKFKPAHRFGLAFNAGVEYMIKRNIGVTFGGRLVWVNLAPKQNMASSDPYKLYINDAKSDRGIDIGFRKQIVYFQFIGGVSLFLHRK
jgi:hypothetical protein